MSITSQFLPVQLNETDDNQLCLWTKQDAQSYTFSLEGDCTDSINAATEKALLLEQEGQDVYFCIIPSRSPHRRSSRNKEADATALASLGQISI